MTANMPREQVERWGGHSCFLGHRGESTFVAIGPTEPLERIGRAAAEEVSKAVSLFYSKEDLVRGYVPRGEVKHPILSLSYSISAPS